MQPIRTITVGSAVCGSLIAMVLNPAASAQDCGLWTRATSSGPSYREGASLVFDAEHGRLVLFGGYDGTSLDDTWEWDCQTRIWSQIGTGGPARGYHACAYDAERRRIVVFGGERVGQGDLGDTWELDGTTWTRICSDCGPSPRSGAAMAFDGHKVVLFGGFDHATQQFRGDTWTWDGSSWSQVPTCPECAPTARDFHSMTYDPDHMSVLLFGGDDGTDGSGDTWRWDGGGWTRVATCGPSPRRGAGMAYDGIRHRVVLFGGLDESRSVRVSDTWLWDGSSWQPLPSSGPTPRGWHAMANNPQCGTDVVFGGTGGTLDDGPFLSDTWELITGGAAIDYQPANQTVIQGRSATFFVIGSFLAGARYQWRRNAVPLDDDGRVSGTATPVLTISPLLADDAASYDVVVETACGTLASDPASLAVVCPCDFNYDGAITSQDFFDFLNCFFAGCP